MSSPHRAERPTVHDDVDPDVQIIRAARRHYSTTHRAPLNITDATVDDRGRVHLADRDGLVCVLEARQLSADSWAFNAVAP